MGIKFHKMQASGNDFIVIDNRKGKIEDLNSLAEELCPRSTSVGADGILSLEASTDSDIKMRIVNADGSEADMCGNGARCAALYSNQVLGLPNEFSMETLAGNIDSTILEDKIRVRLTDPHDFRDIVPIEVKDGIFYCYHINTGVPHLIVFEENVSEFPVAKIGRELRFHEAFQPEGANVNFVEIHDPGLVQVRTYERGVENETLACGTGSTAAAIVSVLIGKCAVPVNVQTQSGEILKVSFDYQKYDVTNVYLEGKAQFVYEGSIPKEYHLGGRVNV